MIGDVIAAALVLLALPMGDWDRAVDRLIMEASVADSYRQRHGRHHPVWGDGSLMAAAGGHPRLREPFLSDIRYLLALIRVLDALVARKLSFVSRRSGLYCGCLSWNGDEDHGRNSRENGVDRSGLAAHL
jgi:hypothetical protein